MKTYTILYRLKNTKMWDFCCSFFGDENEMQRKLNAYKKLNRDFDFKVVTR